jgi:KipI family sensor histidine kinase inhibitor
VTAPSFLPCGDGGLTVEFGRTISPALNARVMRLDALLNAAQIPGMIESVPTYRSLFIQYDPVRLSFDALVDAVRRLEGTDAAIPLVGRHWRVPVAYGGHHGIDLEAVARRQGLSPDAVVRLHSSTTFRVYMIGFAPGFTYLGGLPEALHGSRLPEPRAAIPAGSVSIGGIQAGIASLSIPSGWHLLGTTPLKPYDLRRAEPFLFAPGDDISFRPISHDDFAVLAGRAEQDGLLPERIA